MKNPSDPKPTHGWTLCETRAFRELETLMEDAQRSRAAVWVVGRAGTGKSTAARTYAAAHGEVFVVSCSEQMRRGDFLRELARATATQTSTSTSTSTATSTATPTPTPTATPIATPTPAATTPTPTAAPLPTGCESLHERLRRITERLAGLESPLVIFDEADKLADALLCYLITLYNALEGRCGMLFLSTASMRRRMESGLARNRRGYDELFSRICRRFVEITPATACEVAALCRANGIDDAQGVARIVEDAAGSGYDLRRVRRAVHRHKRLAALR